MGGAGVVELKESGVGKLKQLKMRTISMLKIYDKEVST